MTVNEYPRHSLKVKQSLVVACFKVVCLNVYDIDDLVFLVVNGDNLVKKHEVNIAEILFIENVKIELRFAVFYVIKSEVANQTACERRKLFKLRGLVFIENFSDIEVRIGILECQIGSRTKSDASVSACKLQTGVKA